MKVTVEQVGGEFGLFADAVSKRLGVAKDTLRNWALKLESFGVIFERNEQKQRVYSEENIRAFEEMKELLALRQPLNNVSHIISNNIKKGFYVKGFQNQKHLSSCSLKELVQELSEPKRIFEATDEEFDNLLNVIQHMETMRNQKKEIEKIMTTFSE